MDSKAPAPRFTAPWWIEFSLRLLLGGYFIVPALQKLMVSPVFFAKALEGYQLFGPPWTSILAVAVPWAEFFAGACLIFRRLYEGSLVLIGGMLVVFVFAVTRAWYLKIDCGCFGSGGANSNYGVHLLLNLVMLACAGALGWMAWTRSGRNAS